MYLFIFFFKQKTAYEILAWLEFRRVLFRSKARLNLKPDQNIKILILSFWYTSGIQELRFECFRAIFIFFPFDWNNLSLPLKNWVPVTNINGIASFYFHQFSTISKSRNETWRLQLSLAHGIKANKRNVCHCHKCQ